MPIVSLLQQAGFSPEDTHVGSGRSPPTCRPAHLARFIGEFELSNRLRD
jgi:hypothetical protein